MKTFNNSYVIQYTVAIQSGVHREINVYDHKGYLIAELECFGNFYSDTEEIQNYLNDNGYGDDDYEFVNVTDTE